MTDAANTPATAQEIPQDSAQAVSDKKKSVKKTEAASKAAESAYNVAELARAARTRFGVPPEIVTAAMRMAGKGKATLTEAQEIVKSFMSREVK